MEQLWMLLECARSAVCNSQIVFDSHMAGKKYATMVKQQQKLLETISKIWVDDHLSKVSLAALIP